MHVILAILGSVITILFYLNRLNQSGVDFGWLNPFSWKRRRNWQKLHSGDPIYSIESPMEATACIMYAMAKGSGDISREQKSLIKELFMSEFDLSISQSNELLSSCSYLMQNDEDKVINRLDKFLNSSIRNFSDEQKESAFDLTLKVAECEDSMVDKQKSFLQQLEDVFLQKQNQKKWA